MFTQRLPGMAHTRSATHQGANAPFSRVHRQRAVAERFAPASGVAVQRFRGRKPPLRHLFHAKTARPASPGAPSRPAKGAVWRRETSRPGRPKLPFRVPTRQLRPAGSSATALRHAPHRPRRSCFGRARRGFSRPINFTYPQPPGPSQPRARTARHTPPPLPPSGRQRLIKHKNLLRFILKQN